MRRIRMIRPKWHVKYDRLLRHMVVIFLAGGVLGTVTCGVQKLEPVLGSLWLLWLRGERTTYWRIILHTIRLPCLLLFCRFARTGRRLTVLGLLFCGAAFSYTTARLILRYGYLGVFLAMQMLLYRLLFLPVLFYFALECHAQMRPQRLTLGALRDLLWLIPCCVLSAAAEAVFSPLVLSFLLWLQ